MHLPLSLIVNLHILGMPVKYVGVYKQFVKTMNHNAVTHALTPLRFKDYYLLLHFKGSSYYDNSHSFSTMDQGAKVHNLEKDPLRLHRNNFRTVNAINFLFSTLHTTPFLYGKILLEVLHLLRVSIATSRYPIRYEPVIIFSRSNQIALQIRFADIQ